MSATSRILSFDPGKRNFAWALMDASANDPYKVVQTGKVRRTITKIQDLGSEDGKFIQELSLLLDFLQPNYVVVERFMARLRCGYNHECVNVALGLLDSVLVQKNVERYFIGAANWKNHFSKQYHNNICETIWFAPEWNISEHEADAIGMCVWSADIEYKRRGLSTIVPIWAHHNCSTCFWSWETDCKRPKPKDWCAVWHGPCHTCAWQARGVCGPKYEHCKNWAPIGCAIG